MIDIIIPSYNQAEYLPDAIESCLNQTAKAEDIIVVDDGSTDGSLEIAKGYPITVISQVNKGLASARNTGIMNSSALYCLFLDADDMLLDNAIERIQETILNNCEPGIGFNGEEIITPKFTVDIVAPSFKCFGVGNERVILGENLTLEDFKIGNRIGYCQAIKRSALLEVGGYSPRMVWGAEDYHLTINLLSRGKKLVTIPEVLWLYRTKKDSMWTETAKHEEEFKAQIKKDFPNFYD